jgi:actin related protein 2/3 complex subunit 1A/1B
VQESVLRIKCSGLPHLRVLFLSNDRLLAAGHDCNPCVLVRKGTQWIDGIKIDDERTGSKAAGVVSSARSAAFKKFEVATTQGNFSNGSASGGSGAGVATAHQSCITDVVTCPAWGGQTNATKFASVGLDGRLCMWDLTGQALETRLSKLVL